MLDINITCSDLRPHCQQLLAPMPSKFAIRSNIRNQSHVQRAKHLAHWEFPKIMYVEAHAKCIIISDFTQNGCFERCPQNGFS